MDIDNFRQTGWVYFANLYLSTSLEVLRQHGRRVPIDGIRIEYGRGGNWCAVHPHMTYGPQAGDGSMLPSFGGQVPADGGDVLPFLIAYRTIIEDESRPVSDRVAAVRALIDDPSYARFARLLEDGVADSWVSDRLCKLLNIGGGPGNALVAHGHLDLPSIFKLSEAELRAMPGIGPKTVAMIRLASKRLQPPQ